MLCHEWLARLLHYDCHQATGRFRPDTVGVYYRQHQQRTNPYEGASVLVLPIGAGEPSRRASLYLMEGVSGCNGRIWTSWRPPSRRWRKACQDGWPNCPPRVPLGRSLRKSRSSMNKSCASTICSAYSSSKLRRTGPPAFPHKHGGAEAHADTTSSAERL